MTTRTRHGFTMVEMIAIVAILAMLIALIMPALGGARLHAVNAKCHSRLHQLGIAYSSRSLDLRASGQIREPVIGNAASWAVELAPYLDHNLEVTQCPSVPENIDHGSEDGKDRFVVVEGTDVQIEDTSLGISISFPLGNTTAMAWKHPWFDFAGPRPEGAFNIAYLDDSNWNYYLNNPDALAGDPPLGYSTAISGDKLATYIYPDRDGPGTVTVYVRKMAHTATKKSYLLLNGQVWTNTNGDVYMGAEKKWYVLPTTLSSEGYGMNYRIKDMRAGDNRVYLLDYAKTVADLADAPGRPHRDSWVANQAPRHFDRMNALLGDGSVRSFHPDELNPNVPDTQTNLWQPSTP